MANFSALKTAIQNAIKQNGNEEITGNVLQQILLSIVNTMGDGAINTIEQNLSQEALARQNGDSTLQSNINAEALARGNADTTLQSHIDEEALTRGNADTQLQNAINAIKADIDNGYVYAGIATPSTTPVSGKVFYAALQAGTYTNFGGTAVTEGITFLKYNGTSWKKEQVLFTDGGVFDISAYHATGGTLATYDDLSAALGTNGANVPANVRKGGMSVKYVQSSDNKYVQARCTAAAFTTDITQWQGVNDVNDNMVNSLFRDKVIVGSLPMIWEQGALRVADGTPYNASNAIRTSFIEISVNNIHILNPDGKVWRVYEYSDQETLITKSNLHDSTEADVALQDTTSFIRIQLTYTVSSSTPPIAIGDAKGFSIVTNDSFIGLNISSINHIISNLLLAVIGTLPLFWEQGAIRLSDGQPYNASNAIRTASINVSDTKYIHVIDPEGKTWRLYEYDNSDVLISSNKVGNNESFVSLDEATSSIRIQLTHTAQSSTPSISVDDAKGFSLLSSHNTKDDINTLKTVNSEYIGILATDWEQGALNGTTGLPYSSSRAIRTNFIDISGHRSVFVYNPNAVIWRLYEYDDEYNIVKKGSTATNIQEQLFNLQDTTAYIKIQIASSDTYVNINDSDGFSVCIADETPLVFKLAKMYARKEISILFVGNSLTQDGVAYLPYVLKTYYPEISFKFYMWYNGGYTLAKQYTKFINNEAAAIFSVAEDTPSWTNYNNEVTMSSILETYKFDIVCLQEYFNAKSSYTDADLVDWNNCKSYIQNNYTGGNGLEFISLFHAPKRTNTDNVYAMIKTGNALILQKTISEDMIPSGIAVYNALSTALDSLGDEGHLSPDGLHTQEGLPCLLQTYTILCWLFDKMSINKSVYGSTLRMTTTIYNSINVPGPNLGTGVITGTDEENLLAQEVAIQAYKEGKSFVNKNIYTD